MVGQVGTRMSSYISQSEELDVLFEGDRMMKRSDRIEILYI